MIPLTTERVYDTALALTRAHPSRRTGHAYSSPDGTPNCLIGHVLHAHGIPLPPHTSAANGYRIEHPRFALPGHTHEPAAIYLLGWMQTKLDNGWTWGNVGRRLAEVYG